MFFSKKFLTNIFLAASLTVQALEASLITKLFGPSERVHLGSDQATQWYQDKAHEFLKYFDVKDADAIEILKLSWHMHPEYRLIPGMTGKSGIWINEAVLEKFDEQERLWVIAHETAHYAYHHVWKKIGLGLTVKIVSSIPAALMGAYLVWRINHDDELRTKALWQNMLNGASMGLIGGMYAIDFQATGSLLLNNKARKYEIEADLMAAQMLCVNGYQATVQVHIQTLSSWISEGRAVWNVVDHPSLEESLVYLQAFWDTYSKILNANQPL